MRRTISLFLTLLACAALSAQTTKTPRTAAPRARQGGGELRRTADGQPDLQGVWNFSTITPLERSAEFAGREFMSDADAARFEARVAQQSNRDNRSDNADADVASAYNEFWWDRGSHVARVHGKARTSLLVTPPDGRIPPLTADGQARAAARAEARRLHAADGPEDRSLGERCLVFNAGPPMLSGPYNNYVQILQTRDHVVILNEMIHDARIVPLDGRPHLPASIRRWAGDSRGRWDGGTLVVETTNFTAKTNLRGSGDALRLVERFTRADADTLLYEFTVDDPASFAQPWSAVLPMSRTDDRIYEYACHEGNYAMAGILRGARAAEAQGTARDH
jgi:hypothetical protein